MCGMRERCFAGTSFQPRKLPENAATPTRRVHAVLADFLNLILYYSLDIRDYLPALFLILFFG